MYKYLKVDGNTIRGENTLTREMLIAVKNRYFDTIINTEDATYFDANKNEWVQIEGTEEQL